MADSDNKITILLSHYANQCEWERHNENQRAQLANNLLIVSAAIIAFLPSNLKPNDWPLPIFLIIIGILGLLSIMKYWERFMYHSRIDEAYYRVLDSYFAANAEQPESETRPSTQDSLLIAIREGAIKEHESKCSPFLRDKNFKQHWLWEGVFSVIIILGVVLTVKALVG